MRPEFLIALLLPIGCSNFESSSSKPISLCRQTLSADSVVIGRLASWGQPVQIESSSGALALATPVVIAVDQVILGTSSPTIDAYLGRQILEDGSSDEGNFRTDGMAVTGAFFLRRIPNNVAINTPFGFLPEQADGAFLYTGVVPTLSLTLSELTSQVETYKSAGACGD